MRQPIKTCPFCGEVGRIKIKNRTVINGQTVRNTYVYCPNCDTRGTRVLYRDFEAYEDAEAKAIEMWNRRI